MSQATLLERPEAPADRPEVGQPGRWGRLIDAAVGLIVVLDLYAIFVLSPSERIQGDVFRIIYVHVPMAWLCYVAFFTTFAASIAYLWKRRPGADYLARASAEVGVLFTTMVLASGIFWGRPVWGVWWTWDARLTTTLVLWFVYVGYLMVRSAIADPERSARMGAVIGVAAFANVPLVQLSVTWWRTLHPTPSVTQPGALTGEILNVLLFSLLAFGLVLARLVAVRMSLLRAQDEARELAHIVAERTEA